MNLKFLFGKSKSQKPLFLKSLSLLLLTSGIFADYSVASIFKNEQKERSEKIVNIVALKDGSKISLAELTNRSEILKSLKSSQQPQTADYIKYQSNNEDNSDITVSGIDLVYDNNNPTQDWNKKIQTSGIQSLTLIGETITLKSSLILPGTNLTIYARNLKFEDNNPQNPSVISTTFESEHKGIKANKGQASQRGKDAGNIKLIIGDLELPSNNTIPRFVMKGSVGQDPFEGKHGKHGKSIKQCRGGFTYIETQHFDTRLAVRPYKTNKCGNKNAKPGSGTNAQAGGKPGDGGNGGNLETNLLEIKNRAATLVSNQGGASGKPNPVYKGGRAGTPSRWAHKKIEIVEVIFGSNERSESTSRSSSPTKAGKDARPQTAKNGTTGQIVSSEEAWLREEVIQNKLQMLQDAYLKGHVELAQQIAEAYLTDRENIAANWVNSPELQIYDRQFIDYYFQLLNNLDYFGNPPGWVPLLSLEVIQDVYKQEIDNSVDLLLLSYVLEERWNKIEQKERSLSNLNQLYRQMIVYHKSQTQKLQKNISQLDKERIKLDAETESFLSRLKQKEIEIETKFANDEAKKQFRRNLVNALTVASQSLAFSGPKGAVVGAPLSGLGSYLSGALEDTPNPPSGTTSTLLENLSEQDEINEARKRLTELRLDGFANSAEFIPQLEELSKIISEGTRQQLENQLQQGVGSETEAKLSRIKQEDPEFGELFDTALELITRKQIFYNKALESVQLVDSHLNEIASYELSIKEINQSLRNPKNQIDLSTRRTLRATRESAKQRLIRYKYYMNKAYEHRLFKPVSSDNYNLDRVFDSLVGSFSLNGTETNSITINSPHFDKLKAVYYDDLNQLKSKIIDTFANNRTASLTKPRKLTLSNEEIQKLNSKGVVEIDLNQHLLLDSDRGAKIIKIQVDPQSTKIAKSSNSSSGQVDITFERSNFSIVRWENKDYYFEYGGKNVEVSPEIGGFNWSYSSAGGQFQSYNLIDNDLVNNLANSKRVYTQPGARTTLKIHRDNVGNFAPVEIQSLVLDVHLEASSRRF